MFFIAVLPAYIAPDLSIEAQTMLLSASYVVIATAVHLAIVALAAQFHGWISVGSRERTVQRVFAILLAAIAFWFLISSA